MPDISLSTPSEVFAPIASNVCDVLGECVFSCKPCALFFSLSSCPPVDMCNMSLTPFEHQVKTSSCLGMNDPRARFPPLLTECLLPTLASRTADVITLSPLRGCVFECRIREFL